MRILGILKGVQLVLEPDFCPSSAPKLLALCPGPLSSSPCTSVSPRIAVQWASA